MKSSEGPVARVHHKGVDVIANVLIARKTHRITLECPEIAEAIRPGQFVMIRLPNQTDPLLGRPYALYDTVVDEPGKPYAIEIVYLVVGKQTHLLTTLGENDKVEIWGPLGNGFDDVPTLGHVALVAGGIGQTPFLAYIKDLLGIRGYGGESARKKAGRVSLFYGARKAEFLAGVEDFEEAGASVHVATDDGSRGHHGLVTQLLEEHLQSGDVSGIVGCGPEPMLQALSAIAAKRQLPCHVSLETPMACGVGICFSCVAAVRTPSGPDYRRVCVEGPVFDAETIIWER